MKVTSQMVLTILAAGVVACAALGAEKPQPQPKPPAPPQQSSQEIANLLVEARDAYLADGAGKKAHPRTLMYVWWREHIEHTPLLPIVEGLAELDDPRALDTVKTIDVAAVRAYGLTRLAAAQHTHGHKEAAQATLAQAVTLLKGKEIDEDTQKALWPHVLGALLTMEGEIAPAKAAAEKLGCPWDALDNEERQIQLARYHLARGDVKKARGALTVLPADTFAARKGREALRGDDGAAFYAWISRSVSNPQSYTADHMLLEWLQDEEKPDQMEEVIANLDDGDVGKLMCMLSLAAKYKEAGQLEQAAAALIKVDALAKTVKAPKREDRDEDKSQDEAAANQKFRDRLQMVILIARLQIEGKTAVDAVRQSGVLEKYRGEPWLSTLIVPLLRADELQLAQQLAEGQQLGDETRANFAIALTKAGKHAEAREHVKLAKSLLGPSKILAGIALQEKENGDVAAAEKTMFDAIAQAKKVPATNQWNPDGNMVRHQEKWHIMTWMYCQAIQMGFGQQAIEQFDNDASIRALGQVFGRRGEVQLVRKWIERFKESDRNEGARCMALLGLAQGSELKK